MPGLQVTPPILAELVQMKNRGGRSTSFSCWRSSDTSEGDAHESALTAAKRILDALLSGRTLDRYGYGCVPLREEVVNKVCDGEGLLLVKRRQAIRQHPDLLDEAPSTNPPKRRSVVQSLNTTGNSTVIRVPLPAELRMLHFPPSSLARCRMPSRPKRFPCTAFASNPIPQSRIII
jgi:hypothetical protein